MINKQRHLKLCKGINVVAPSPMKRCDECDYETKYQSHLNRHKKKHSSFVCEECGESLTTLQKLDKHKSQEHPVKYNECDECDFKSRKKWLRNRHQEMHCAVKKNKLIPALTKEEAIQLFSDCDITKAAFNKILRHIRRKWGRHALAKNCSVSNKFLLQQAEKLKSREMKD